MSYSISDRDRDLSKWKVADLKKELKLRGLSAEGKKNDLIERLQPALGGSHLLDDTINDQDELLDEDVLMDEEPDALEDVKSDTLENVEERDLSTESLKRKSNDNTENQKQPSKKITLNRNFVSITKETSKVEGKENKDEESQQAHKPNIIKVGSLTPQERLERRAAKFGVAMSTEAKKEARAIRFGLQSPAGKVGGAVSANIDVLKKRAARFGTTLPGSILEKAEIEERKKKRQERFGKIEAPSTMLKAKPENATSLSEQKKQMRAERFKLKS